MYYVNLGHYSRVEGINAELYNLSTIVCRWIDVFVVALSLRVASVHMWTGYR
jgi:hypothetical protein